MIQAGDFIDTTLGVTFALSTLTAAGIFNMRQSFETLNDPSLGFGQIFSDVAGITCVRAWVYSNYFDCS